MLEQEMKGQIKAYLERITLPVELLACVDDSDSSTQLMNLLRDVAAQSDLVFVIERRDVADRKPSFRIQRAGTDIGVDFAGIPMGHEFSSLVLALLQVGGHPSKLGQDILEQIRNVEGEFRFETYVSLSCQNCPDVVQTLNLLSVINPRIQHVTIDGALFQDEVTEREVMAVPTVFLNGSLFAQGRIGMEEVLPRIDEGAEARSASRLDAEAPFDVLIVGGGPAGAAAAVYAARKGVRTGIVAERFGGQVLDTMGIENYISVAQTEGPRFVADLEQHVRQYDVQMMNAQRASKLVPAAAPGVLTQVRLVSGVILEGRSIILSTGARWRNVGVPGEQEYRNRGVAYCPHCDGPLFKGKRVAVIGGGNSGVEAAIDLAGIVGHVTVLEFADDLKADAVLVKKLESLSNVDIHTGAQTTEIRGDGKRVSGLRYTHRRDGTSHEIALEGVFVQIGLVPNTEWLKGSVELSRFGEIVVDERGATNVPGVFAAGDATTTPYKQIVIAAGDGSKAALSAFDHLIRSPLAEAA